jgi:large subunit ribosomal protein L15
VNLGQLDRLEGSEFSVERLMSLGVVKKLGDGVKVLAGGELTRAITIEAHHFSKTAQQKIEQLGGSAKVLGA